MQLVEHDPAQRREQVGASSDDSSQRECSGVVRQDVGRMAALALAARGRRGVSPVRVSTRIGNFISSIGFSRFARDIHRQRLHGDSKACAGRVYFSPLPLWERVVL